MSAKNLHPDNIRGNLVDISFAPEPSGVSTAGRSAVQAFECGRKGHWPPPKPKPLQTIDFRSLVLRDRLRSSRCFENLALFFGIPDGILPALRIGNQFPGQSLAAIGAISARLSLKIPCKFRVDTDSELR
jgi:hypothetical protein